MPPYAIANVAVDHVPVEIGMATGLWRSGAHSYTCFFTECFVDELARAAGLEPLSFRMRMLGQNQRLARVLQTATAIGGWDGGPPGSGMGIAAHSAFGSHVATLVEIEIGRDQRIRVQRAVCAVDCGRIINPEIVRQQIEGGIIHGIAAATGDPIEIVDGTPTARSIGAYRLPTLRDSPEVTVELIESDEEPGGVTELAVPTAAPAVANALFSLTGQRQRTAAARRRGPRVTPPSDHPAIPDAKIGVLLINLGTPNAPEPGAVRLYLKEFLSDPRVVEIPQLVWQPILRGIILNTRPRSRRMPIARSGPRKGSPLAAITARQARRSAGAFGPDVDRRPCDALRQAGDRRADRRAQGAGLRPDPDRAALSAILRRDDRDRQ